MKLPFFGRCCPLWVLCMAVSVASLILACVAGFGTVYAVAFCLIALVASILAWPHIARR